MHSVKEAVQNNPGWAWFVFISVLLIIDIWQRRVMQSQLFTIQGILEVVAPQLDEIEDSSHATEDAAKVEV